MQREDRIEDAEGKYLLPDIHWSIALKAKLRKPLFLGGKIFGNDDDSNKDCQVCGAGEAHQKGLVSPH